jgi:cytochrome c oxidase subunit 2
LTRDIVLVAILWVVLTALGWGVMLTFTPFPIAAAVEARIIDDAFTILTVLAVPVFTFVVATLMYSAFRFRSKGTPTEDGPPIRTHRPTIALWLLITTALTVVIIVHPGITGLNDLQAHDDEDVDVLVQVEGTRWVWKVTYPQFGVSSRKELVLPIGEHARFDVTARDVLHSFWIPAFRVKIDAVPGLVTTTFATPDTIGDFDMDANFRLQCAELCGLSHALMQVPVRVVERSEFDEWIAQQ